MDMEEYFYYTQEKIKQIIKEIEEIKVNPYHKKTQIQKDRTIEELKKLHEEFEF